MGNMAIMGKSGDTKLIWSPGNEAEVDNARRTFNDLKAKRFVAFAVKKDGEKGERVTEFDADAEKIIMVPPMQGG